MNEIQIGSKKISHNSPVFIIAEAGVNHILQRKDLDYLGLKSNLEVAYKLVDEAKNAGADAIKFQSFSAKKLQLEGTEKPLYQKNQRLTQSYFDLLQSLETDIRDQKLISDYSLRKKIQFLSTPYDNDSADFLDSELRVPAFKLASIETNNHLFLDYICSKNKPIILSTGLSIESDVIETFEFIKKRGFAKNLILLHCNSDYPTPAADVNLNVLLKYRRLFPETLLGFSDHTISSVASLGAISLGAKILEKHFTLDENFSGPDHKSSLNPKNMKSWILKIRELEDSFGIESKIITNSEKSNLTMRKFLVIDNIEKNGVINENNLKAMRTGKGVLPQEKNLQKIIGKKIKITISEPTAFNWDMLKE